jgi:hypothetical protein
MFWLYIDPYKELASLFERAINHPLLLCIACLLGGTLVIIFKRAIEQKSRWVKPLIVAGALGLISYHISTALWYLYTPAFLDHTEPYVPILSRIVGQGGQLYHSLDNAERYSVLYGPMLFMANLLFNGVSQDIIFSTKFCGVFFCMMSLLVIFLTFKRRCDNLLISLQMGFMVLCYLWFGHYSYWNKAEPLLLFCGSVACCSVFIQNAFSSVLLMSMAMSIAINTKIHAFFYLAPFLIYLLMYRGLKHFLLCIGASLIFVLLPFISIDSFSVINYVQWIIAATRHPLSLFIFILNIKYLLLLFLPIVFFVYIKIETALVFSETKYIQRLMIAAVICSMLIICIIASKVGAGPHHLLPFAPSIAFLMGFFYSSSPHDVPSRSYYGLFLALLVFLFLLAGSITAIRNQCLVLPFLRNNNGRAICNDLKQLKNEYNGKTMQMGYGDNEGYPLTWFRPLLWKSMQGYLLDAAAIMDMKRAGIKIPSATMQMITNQTYDIWLIPRNTAPFSMRTLYEPYDALWEEGFKNIFLQNYQQVAPSQYYSVWIAKRLVEKQATK